MVSGIRVPRFGALGPALAVAFLSVTPVRAQAPARFSLDSAVAVDVFQGQNASDRPNIVIDVTGVVRLAEGWVVYLRPWFRQPRAPSWDKEIYQAALQYERPGRIGTRVDVGYLASPVGLGMMDTRPGVNPTIGPHFSYVSPMPAFDPTAPRAWPIASTYPLGGQLTLSGFTWDTRVAVVSTAPARIYVINSPGANPKSTPVFEAGAGVTPTIGLRLGASVAHGKYATAEEITGPATDGRQMTMVGTEGEYAFGHTKIAGEATRDSFETALGPAIAYGWFVQGMQTLTPRWFVAARQEGASAPPLRTGIIVGARRTMQVTETTVGFRLSTDFTLRGSFLARKVYTRATWDQQGGVSIVWAHRWQ